MWHCARLQMTRRISNLVCADARIEHGPNTDWKKTARLFRRAVLSDRLAQALRLYVPIGEHIYAQSKVNN